MLLARRSSLRSFARWLAIVPMAMLLSPLRAPGQGTANELTVEKIFGHGPLTGHRRAV